ncbi:MAG: hypothetical protein EB133_02645, partial [Betaproteobacteria bacterium]|nr:hypothetical protein [Betaproteobacteria bacterium]
RPEVRAQFAKLSVSITNRNCPIEPAFSYADRVRLSLHNGSVLDSGDIRFARGNAMNPLSMEELEGKFLDCTARAPGVDGKRLFEQLTKLPTLGSIQQLKSQALI